MKAINRIIAIAFVALLGIAPAAAQVRFGVKAGVAINDLKFNRDAFNADNRAGFTGGVMMEVGVPLVGLSIDGSLLYAHRSAEFSIGDGKSSEVFKRDYIDIPINLKYKFNIIGISNFVAPYIFTGPDFAVLVSDKESEGGTFENTRLNTSWNVGFGAEFLRHLQVSASYGIGLTKAIKSVTGIQGNDVVNGKDRFWTVTAAYLF